MNEKKIIVGIVLTTTLILFGGIFWALSGSPSKAIIASSQNAKATVDSKTYDWGSIPFKGGDVRKIFTIKSIGTDTLKLSNIKTSCHCTKAQIKIGNIASPYFGMNSVSTWIGEIPPGQEAQLEVIFDPAYHGPQGVGPINRLINIETNDPSNSRLEFSLTGTVYK